VGPDVPRGREAREAWRALSPQAREAAFAAAKQGVAPPDLGIAWAAAGYGRLMVRRLRTLRMLTPTAFILLALPVGTLIVANRSWWPYTNVVFVGLGALVIGGVVGVMAGAGRYQRLYSSGLLGLQAAGLGMGPSATSPLVWQAAQSEFTVPYQARVPLAEPVPRPVADPAATGTTEVPVRRGPVLTALALFATVALIFWLATAALAPDSAPGAAMLAVVAAIWTGLAGFLLFATWPALRHPVLARFTPAGWELPTVGTAGSWSALREIRVRPISTRGPAAASPQLATFRAVVLMLDNPGEQLARLPSLRRALLRRTMKRYGSPAVIVATPRRTIPLADLIVLLQRYTNAPVTWS
jgi:hypothetical protein